MSKLAVFVVLTALVFTAASASACLYVNVRVPLRHSYNPVTVIDGDSWLVEQACLLWEGTINLSYYGQEWWLYVADGSAPNTVSSGSSSPAQCIRYYTSDGLRIASFDIEFDYNADWCESSDPSTCEINTWSFLDVMTHELGHAVGLDHCSNIMDCDTFTAMNPEEQWEAYPTMVGADESGGWDNCYYYNYGCGYIPPFVVMHTLSSADIAAARSMYDGQVVQTQKTISRVIWEGDILKIDFFPEWNPGSNISVMGSATPEWPEFQVSSGTVPVLVDSRGRRAEVPLAEVEWELNYLWVQGEYVNGWLGPFTVEKTAVATVPRSPLVGQAIPNPFNPATIITFEIRTPGKYQGVIYDLRGRQVARLCDETMEMASYTVSWNGRMDSGESAPAGGYVFMLKGAGYSKATKLTLLK